MNDKDYLEILGKLTLDEKVSMLSGSTNWLTQPVKRDDIDIPAVRMSDGPSGLRREKIGKGVNIMQTPYFLILQLGHNIHLSINQKK